MGYRGSAAAQLAGAATKIAAANRRSAEDIANRARAATSDNDELRGSIRVDGDGLEVRVLAGRPKGRRAPFYAHLTEYGSVNNPAKPFLTPAAEAERAGHRAAVRRALKT